MSYTIITITHYHYGSHHYQCLQGGGLRAARPGGVLIYANESLLVLTYY